jgi:DNA ligase 1
VASFHDFAELCQSLSQTQSRNQMADLAGEFLARLGADEAGIAARFMIGRALAVGEEKRLQVSGRAIWRTAAEITGSEDQGEEIFAAAVDFGEAVEMVMRLRAAEPEPTLTIGEVYRRFAEIAEIEGRHARRRKLDALREMLEAASALEAKYIAKILIREMRHGMSEGLMIEAIARMAGRPVDEVGRAHMFEGDVGRLARRMHPAAAEAAPGEIRAPSIDTQPVAPAGPAPAERGIKPLKPMLAQPARDIAEAFALLGPALALEHKLDGARVQIHRASSETKIFSRRLNEITPSLPEIVELCEAMGVRSAILDGEVIAVDADRRPLAFQELMRRFRRVHEIDRLRREIPIRLFVFDLMALDGEWLIDRPYRERFELLSELGAKTAGLELVGRIVPASLAEGERFYASALAEGYEGVMAKALESRYTPGVRGRGWLKVKRARTLDLVIAAADWGYGRRHGWLSNYHLAARGERTGEFVEVGKTFKGLTDDQFRDITERLLGLQVAEEHGTVFVRPEIVVEVAYGDVQRSPQYASGVALRFARIVNVRDDKSADEADTIETVMNEFERQPLRPRPRHD